MPAKFTNLINSSEIIITLSDILRKWDSYGQFFSLNVLKYFHTKIISKQWNFGKLCQKVYNQKILATNKSQVIK
jgi:hypothetical protein